MSELRTERTITKGTIKGRVGTHTLADGRVVVDYFDAAGKRPAYIVLSAKEWVDLVESGPVPDPDPDPPPPASTLLKGVMVRRDASDIEIAHVKALGAKIVRMDWPPLESVKKWEAAGINVLPMCYWKQDYVTQYTKIADGKNEPYWPSVQQETPESVAASYKAWRTLAKKTNPDMLCLLPMEQWAEGSGCLWPPGAVDRMYQAVPDLVVDAVSFHPYADYKDPRQAGLVRMDLTRADFQRHGWADPKFVISEVGWSQAMESDAAIEQHYRDLFVGIAARPWIIGVTLYCSYDYDSNAGTGGGAREARFGLWRDDWTEKPYLSVVREWMSKP